MTKSGADIGAENARRLADYLAGLEQAGAPLPSRGGKPNLSAVAIACGFDRQVLYKNPAAAALLESFIERTGSVPTLEGGDDQPDEKPKSDRRDNRIRQLEQQLAAARAEVTGLREQLKRLRHVEQHMVETGRGVRDSLFSPSLGGIGKP